MLLFLSVLFLLVASATIRVLKEAAVAVFFGLWYLNLERAAEAPLFQHRACDLCWFSSEGFAGLRSRCQEVLHVS